MDDLYPHVMIGLKLLWDNECQVDIENETPKITIKDQAEAAVRSDVGNSLDRSTNERICALQIEAEI